MRKELHNCLDCQFFDPQHMECNSKENGGPLKEMLPETCLEVKTSCWRLGDNNESEYWKQRSVEAESVLEDLAIAVYTSSMPYRLNPSIVKCFRRIESIGIKIGSKI